MNDMNNNPDSSGQAPQQPLDPNTLQNEENAVKESTYWESKNQNTEPSQDETKMDTPAQFYQHYQQQMNGVANAPQNQMPPQMATPQPPEKKSHKKLFTAFIIVLALLSISAVAYAFRSNIINTFSMMTKSPAEYYAFVEEKAVGNVLDAEISYVNSADKKFAYDTSVDVTYDREQVDSLLKDNLGTGLTDIENSLGLKLDSFGVKALIASNGSNAYESIGLKLNQVDIITMDMFIDTVKQEVLLCLPELSPAYLKQSLITDGTATGINTSNLSLLTPERTNDFIKRYDKIIVEQIKQVELSKNAEVNLDTISATCNQLTVTIDNDSMYEIVSAVLKEAKEDEYIFDILPLLSMTKEEYQESITSTETNLKENIDSSFPEGSNIEMIVSVDNRGDIIGRDISVKAAGSSLGSVGYLALGKDDTEEFNFYIKDKSSNVLARCFGTKKKVDGSYDGNATLELSDTIPNLPGSLSFNIAFEDVRTEKKDNQVYQYGTYTLSSVSMFGIVVILQNDVVDDVQQNKLILQMGATSLLTVDAKTKYLKDYTMPALTGNEEVYDLTDYSSYLTTLNTEAFLTRLSEQLGINLQDIIGSLVPNTTGE